MPELRKRKILYNALGSDEQVLEVFKEINTYANVNRPIFHDVKDKIEEHYNNSMKKCIGEVRYEHFRNVRTAIAWLAAVSLIVIASVSLYYSGLSYFRGLENGSSSVAKLAGVDQSFWSPTGMCSSMPWLPGVPPLFSRENGPAPLA
ncbi:hypothetical protein Sango_0637400 [Sesamum angolense]|uniref:Uncharacterized protein n=1 Tax=Sesamum angolense TaxID=2727404 RepID=A0AAE2C258_9LAMI|nr:hypothetical protein Sango_0637400 [Sesamum angolense]